MCKFVIIWKRSYRDGEILEENERWRIFRGVGIYIIVRGLKFFFCFLIFYIVFM